MFLTASLYQLRLDAILTEIRHTAEQSDGLTSYSYTQHDGRSFSIQDLVDGKNNVKLTVSWLKSEDGRDWSVRIEGDAIDPGMLGKNQLMSEDGLKKVARPARTSFIYHLGLEGLGELALLNEPDDDVSCFPEGRTEGDHAGRV